MNSEKLIDSFAFIKKYDRSLKNWQFVSLVALVILCEVLLFRYLGFPLSVYKPIIILSAYVPFNFLFFCNIIGVGSARELLWMGFIISLIAISINIFDALNLTFIISLSASLTVYLCWAGFKDPYCRYRKGIRLLYEAKNPERALWHLQRAVNAAPDVARYKYHLGQTNTMLGEKQKGEKLIQDALNKNRNLIEELKKDPLFSKEWVSQEG